MQFNFYEDEKIYMHIWVYFHTDNSSEVHVLLPIYILPLNNSQCSAIEYELEPNTASASSWTTATQWFTTCTQNHNECRRIDGDIVLPTRLIDVGLPGSSTELRIIYTKDECPAGPYMTLSHRWGFGSFLKLTASTSKMLQEGFNSSVLPQTFQDAVTIVRKFDVRFLWIDSLCILQDSDEDWKSEASMMGNIYRNSLCNIAATGFHSSDNGLFVERNTSLVCPYRVESLWGENSNGGFALIYRDFWKEAIDYAPLNSRGWVVQERFLAPRILHFCQDQLYWECYRLYVCEAFPAGIPRNMGIAVYYKQLSPYNISKILKQGFKLNQFSGTDGYSPWQWTVEHFRRCDLTKEEDKLVAISGIAKITQLVTGDEYLASLWRRALPMQLLWMVTKCKQENGLPSCRPRHYRAPSWSWASVDGSGLLGGCYEHNALITVLEAYVTPLTGDPTGQIVDGYIRLRGLLIESKVRKSPYDSNRFELVLKQCNLKGCHVYPDVKPTDLDGTFYCLPIHSCVLTEGPFTRGIVLQKTGIVKNEYTRFGYFSVSGEQMCQFFNPCTYQNKLQRGAYNYWDIQTIKLV